eukprot:766086-Pelagomonas_calceolata.AAC.2
MQQHNWFFKGQDYMSFYNLVFAPDNSAAIHLSGTVIVQVSGESKEEQIVALVVRVVLRPQKWGFWIWGGRGWGLPEMN